MPVIVYMGTPVFSVPALEALCRRGWAPALVYTQPDRPRGRGRQTSPPPVAQAARRLGLEVRQPEILQTEAEREIVERVRPDLFVVAAYGKILRQRWLGLPRLGAVNLHPSLLPRHRGINPMGRTLMRGDAWTGVTTFLMDEGTDTGPILFQEATPVDPQETLGELSERLSRLGAEIVLRTVGALLDGSARPLPQDAALATHAAPFAAAERWLSWRRPAVQVHDWVRALSPEPGARVMWRGRSLKILRVRPLEEASWPVRPGQIFPSPGSPPRVGCWPGRVELLEVQPEGKGVMSGEAWLRGQRDLGGLPVLEEGG